MVDEPEQGAPSTAEAELGQDGPEIEELERELATARDEAAANQDRYLRARADMENYKKRIERTYSNLTKSSKKELLAKLLHVEDNLERALHYGSEGAGGESLLEGVRLTKYQLDQILDQEGVQSIQAQGKPFNPELEEALHTVYDPDVPADTVVEVARKGYTYQDEVLRPAQVVVSVPEKQT
ncbi:MAG: nucleotide exchange factor GrpE [Chloroflexota bacterium]